MLVENPPLLSQVLCVFDGHGVDGHWPAQRITESWRSSSQASHLSVITGYWPTKLIISVISVGKDMGVKSFFHKYKCSQFQSPTDNPYERNPNMNIFSTKPFFFGWRLLSGGSIVFKIVL